MIAFLFFKNRNTEIERTEYTYRLPSFHHRLLLLAPNSYEKGKDLQYLMVDGMIHQCGPINI